MSCGRASDLEAAEDYVLEYFRDVAEAQCAGAGETIRNLRVGRFLGLRAVENSHHEEEAVVKDREFTMTKRMHPVFKRKRVRDSDKSMASNILYGHPNGQGGLRPWTVEEIAEVYKIGYRWARVIVDNRDRFIDPADDRRYGNRMRQVARFARLIARIRDSDHPESVRP